MKFSMSWLEYWLENYSIYIIDVQSQTKLKNTQILKRYWNFEEFIYIFIEICYSQKNFPIYKMYYIMYIYISLYNITFIKIKIFKLDKFPCKIYRYMKSFLIQVIYTL